MPWRALRGLYHSVINAIMLWWYACRRALAAALSGQDTGREAEGGKGDFS